MKSYIPAALLMTTVLLSCNGNTPEGGVPLPRSYHRINIYNAEYETIDSLPLRWEANRGSTVTAKELNRNGIFLDLSYPNYNATLHITFSTIENDGHLSELIANRTERMKLNAGDEESEVIEFNTPEGFSSTILITPKGTPTPVQFISYNRKWAVSGALLLSSVPQSADSIAPVTEAVAKDVTHALQCLK